MEVLQSLEYFKSSVLDPDHEIHDIIEQTDHPYHSKVMADLRAIPADVLEEYCTKHHVDFFLGRVDDKDLGRRNWCLVGMLRDQIAIERKRMLIAGAHTPYSFEGEFSETDFDEYGLVDIHKFEPLSVGLARGDNVFQICQSLDTFNSSYWLSDLILKEAFRNNRKFMVRLDPLIKVPRAEYQPIFAKMWVYGTALDWERLKSLRGDEHGQWLANSLSQGEFTDFVWSPNDKEIHFTCEELPKDEENQTRGSRYLHAIFNKNSGKVIHCDGAIRYYTDEELAFRKKFHVRNAEVRKIGKRIKLFLIEEHIDQALFMNLATNFLVWNEDALKYFN